MVAKLQNSVHKKALPCYAYMPFGAGLRIYIGNPFAMMESHLLLAMLAQRVGFELLPRQHIEPDPTKTITCGAREEECQGADAIKLPSLPMTINHVKWVYRVYLPHQLLFA
jgi:hypothetical protein